MTISLDDYMNGRRAAFALVTARMTDSPDVVGAIVEGADCDDRYNIICALADLVCSTIHTIAHADDEDPVEFWQDFAMIAMAGRNPQ